MAFTIPDRALTYPFQSRWFESDIAILQAAAAGRNGVILGGCAVTESAIPAGTTEVETGQVVIDYTLVDVAAQTVGHDVADALLPRFDLVVVYDDGTAASLAGTPDAAPLVPLPDTASVAVAQVFIPAGDTAIENEQIVDKRVIVESPLLPSPWTMLPCATDLARSGTATYALDPVMQFTMAANGVYRVRFSIMFHPVVVAFSSGGFKTQFAGPTSVGSTGVGTTSTASITGSLAQQQALHITAGTTTFTGPTLPPGGIPATSAVWLLDGGLIVKNGATGGAFGFSWAQSTANANALIRDAGSWMEYQRAD